MRVVVAGGHGKVAMRLSRLLSERGDLPIGLIRNPDHADEVAAIGAEAIVFDLEGGRSAELAEHLTGADAVVFAAGAGPGSGVARKDTVDRAGAAILADAAEQAGVRRYLLISAMRVDADDPEWEPPPDTTDVFRAYLRAKAASERDLRSRNLEWTVLRPGILTDDQPTGRVRLAAPRLERGTISRGDVAEVLVGLLDEPHTAGLTLELVGGDLPVPDAVRTVTGQ